MPEITPDSNLYFSSIKPVTTREELISLLVSASELEHGLACAYLFAAYSLKNDASEGGLTDAQTNMVSRWRRSLMRTASDRMFHLLQISNLLTAVGGTPHITRPTFPVVMSDDPAGAKLPLEPFSQVTIDRLITYERFNGTTIGDLYARVATGFRSLPAQELFVSSSKIQENPHFLKIEGRVIAVIDQDSASAAIAMITGKGNEVVLSSDSDMDASGSATIKKEYAAALADAQQSGLPFEPVRPVGKNPRTHLLEELAGSTPIVDPLTEAVADLFNKAYDIMLLLLKRFFLHTEETDVELERLAQTTRRLMDAVIRPLGKALTQMPANNSSLPGLFAGPPFCDSISGNVVELEYKTSIQAVLDEQLWQMATAATTLCITSGLPSEVREATAALQDLACQFAPADGPAGVTARVAALKQMQVGLSCAIQSSINGPYLVTNADTLTTWLGENIPTRPLMALCRCGKSASKPFCDGTHASVDFTSQKDPKRVSDRRETYVGQQVTVLDNRGICAHSGFCTDRLSSAFHAGQEPFVSPSGARMDEIIRAVRACPSGALSYEIGDIEVRNQVDQKREPTIEVSKDGPYRITGGIALKDGQGKDEARNKGASDEHYSLCRCGYSQNKPFCSGMHWYVNFHDPVADPDHEPTVFEWAGGLPALLRLTRTFYGKYVPQDPLIGPLFANMSPDHPERVATWLGEVFGGPNNYSEQYGGYSRMLSQHVGKHLTEAQRARWVSLLFQSADDAGLPNDAEFRAAFISYIEWGSRLAVENSQTDSRPPKNMPTPHWWWTCNATPWSRISALAVKKEGEQKQIVLPAPNEAVSFEAHIKPLFRAMDRQSMKFIFDLWSYQDVRTNADSILQRLQKGSMPCDGAWSQEKVKTFQRWVESNMQE